MKNLKQLFDGTQQQFVDLDRRISNIKNNMKTLQATLKEAEKNVDVFEMKRCRDDLATFKEGLDMLNNRREKIVEAVSMIVRKQANDTIQKDWQIIKEEHAHEAQEISLLLLEVQEKSKKLFDSQYEKQAEIKEFVNKFKLYLTGNTLRWFEAYTDGVEYEKASTDKLKKGVRHKNQMKKVGIK